MLPFLYPAATRRYLSRSANNLPAFVTWASLQTRTASPIAAHGRQYSTSGTSEEKPEDQPSDPAEPDPWGYLLGEATPEEEESLKPKKRPHTSFFPSRSHPSGSPPSHTRHNRGRLHASGQFGDSGGVVDDASMSSDGPRSNMTEREKVIFDMIFNRLLNKPATGSSTPQKQQTHSRPSPMISALFESAVGPQRSGDEVSFGPERTGVDDKGSMQAVLSKGDFPASLRYAAAGAMGLSRKAVGLESDENSEERLEEYKTLKAMLEECESDLQIWEFLDTHVFPMATSSAVEASDDQTAQASGTGRPNKLSKPKAVDAGEVVIPSSNYPKLLHNAISMLRTTYRDFPSCVAIFERVKQLGPESYIIGCSIAVYNQMLLVRWKGYRDVQSVLDLLDEMRLNGVQGNVETAGIVSDVLNDIMTFESDSFLPGGVMMWQNGDVMDGKSKLRSILSLLVREGNQAKNMKI
ncbi:hypothetical protein ABW19_dt0202145 [Dactylella cylindrospora]|nr:hypothetical protein ABW19_dt0202145 [Dactylella cylindrospora]